MGAMTDRGPSVAVRRRGHGLSRPRIARVALELIDERGVGAASMRTIARCLGVEAMSLYKYFHTRDELLDAVVDLIVDELDADPQGAAGCGSGVARLPEPTCSWRPTVRVGPSACVSAGGDTPRAGAVGEPTAALAGLDRIHACHVGRGELR